MKKGLYILIVFIVVSCTSNTIYKKPKDLIPKDTMTNLLTDMYIASSAKNIKNKNLEKKVNYLALIYRKYRIDSTRFKASNIYYTSVIEEYSELLVEVKKRLKAQQKTYTDSLKIIDSLKTVAKKKNKEQNKKLLKLLGKKKQKNLLLKDEDEELILNLKTKKKSLDSTLIKKLKKVPKKLKIQPK